MRTIADPQGLSWLAAQLRWERQLEKLRRDADAPVATPAPAPAGERPQAA